MELLDFNLMSAIHLRSVMAVNVPKQGGCKKIKRIKIVFIG